MMVSIPGRRSSEGIRPAVLQGLQTHSAKTLRGEDEVSAAQGSKTATAVIEEFSIALAVQFSFSRRSALDIQHWIDGALRRSSLAGVLQLVGLKLAPSSPPRGSCAWS